MPKIIKTNDKRRVFVNTLNKLAEKDKNIIVIIPDVGFNYLNGKHNFKVVNVGVAEQFATIFATALALDGWKPYLYSMINFVLFRPAEMVRNGVVMHKANVKLMGVKGSSAYKFLGFSHNLLHEKEDENFCKNIGLRSFKPKDEKEVEKVIKETYKSNKSCYIQL